MLKGDSLWSRSNTDELLIPIGITGAQKVQYLAFGQGTTHHALIAGTTGSGKSNLLHVMINSAAYCYSPEELEMYLLDFKEGSSSNDMPNIACPTFRSFQSRAKRRWA
ncbi:MAG: FtsK/SpoIIIE domain-containing protein [Deinococcales bacterium]